MQSWEHIVDPIAKKRALYHAFGLQYVMGDEGTTALIEALEIMAVQIDEAAEAYERQGTLLRHATDQLRAMTIFCGTLIVLIATMWWMWA